MNKDNKNTELDNTDKKSLISDVMCSFDSLIDELVIEVRKYFEYPPYNRTPFDDDFPQKMKNEWKENIEGLKERIEYYKYLNKKRSDGVFL